MMAGAIRRSIIVSVTSSTILGDIIAPEYGCYYFDFKAEMFDVEAQINVKSATEMDFALRFVADPAMGMPDTNLLCIGEEYHFEQSPPSAVVGSTDISPCLKQLARFSNGVVTIPMVLGYDSVTNSFKFKMVIDIVMERADKCASFGFTSTDDNKSVSTTTHIPTFAKGQETGTIVTTTTTTKAAFNLSLGAISCIYAALAVFV